MEWSSYREDKKRNVKGMETLRRQGGGRQGKETKAARYEEETHA